MSAATAPALAADLETGPRRLMLAAMRHVAPTCWSPRRPAVDSPGTPAHPHRSGDRVARRIDDRAVTQSLDVPFAKTIDVVDVSASSIPAGKIDYLATMEWITARENLALIGLAGTGKSQDLVAFGVAAVHAGLGVRYLTTADLVDTLDRGLADNSLGKVIDTCLRRDLIICDEMGDARLDDTCAQLLSRYITAAYEMRSIELPPTGHSTSRTCSGETM